MASQVLSGANNASYTNNTGQNVRLIINYMNNVTSMTWAGVTTTSNATIIGKDVPISYKTSNFTINLPGGISGGGVLAFSGPASGYFDLVPSTNGNFPTELMLANGESFSSVCGAYNAIVIKEDGT